MHFNFFFFFLCLNFMWTSAFFLWKLKKEPLFFCFKVCPLYCSKHRKSDLDDSASSIIEDEWPGPPSYWEEPEDHHSPSHSHSHIYPIPEYHSHEHHPPHEYEIIKHLKFIYKPYTTTTTAKPTTTTSAPSGICEACMKKCFDWQLEHPYW